ncbi:MAG: PHP domain-containing protein [Deltaproteobacteria bacterium]|nr:PHP domain-containing protein [Deltaproteobacteria bacterium]
MDCKQAGIDLHIHSTASDGTLSPVEILRLAEKLELGAISITDHDTLKGSKDLLEAAGSSDVRVLTGIEISTIPPALYTVAGSFHILGYGIRLNDPALNQTLETLQRARENRNPLIISRLNAMGLDITVEEVIQVFGEAQIGRPHIAQLLIKKGFVQTFDEAFDVYLGFNKPAYMDKYRMDCQKAIEMIIEAGGTPVLAHPFLLRIPDNSRLEALVATLKEMGLQGIEVYYPEHSSEDVEFYSRLALSHDLAITGGTDFHGAIKPEIQLGYGKGDFFVPYSVYDLLLKRQQTMV